MPVVPPPSSGGGASSANIIFLDEGSAVGTAVGTAIVNSVGAGIAATYSGGTATLTVTGGTAAGSVIVLDEGSTIGTATHVNIVGAGGTASFSGGTATITVSSGGVTQAYVGYNTVGGSWETLAANYKVFLKQIVLANDCFIPSVEAYIRGPSTSNIGGPIAVLYLDSSGTPTHPIATGVSANTNNVVAVTTTPHWQQAPLSHWATAGTYWIGVRLADVGGAVLPDIAYDVGTDETQIVGNYQFPIWAGTATSRKFSIRAPTLR